MTDVLGLLFWAFVVLLGAALLAADIAAVRRWGFRGTQARARALLGALTGSSRDRLRLAEYVAGRELRRPDHRRIAALERDLDVTERDALPPPPQSRTE